MKLFESEKYNMIMSLATIIVVILILFSFVSIFQEIEKKSEIKKIEKGLTGKVIAENESFNETDDNIKMHTLKAYGFYYMFILLTVILIVGVSAAVILPRFKNWT
jgi:ammonia channel protein AmtB